MNQDFERAGRAIALTALLTAFCAVALVALIVFFVEGLAGLSGVLVAAGLVILFFASGHLVQIKALQRAGDGGMTMELISFVVRIALFAVALYYIVRWGMPSERLTKLGLGAGTIAAILGWQLGVVLASRKSRLPIIQSTPSDEDLDAK